MHRKAEDASARILSNGKIAFLMAKEIERPLLMEWASVIDHRRDVGCPKRRQDGLPLSAAFCEHANTIPTTIVSAGRASLTILA